MKLIWNGGFELDWKVIGAILWGIWMTAGGWYKLNNLEQAVITHNAWASQRSDELTVIGSRLNSLEERVDPCCPLFAPKPLTIQHLGSNIR